MLNIQTPLIYFDVYYIKIEMYPKSFVHNINNYKNVTKTERGWVIR